jgi:hypothetical protein
MASVFCYEEGGNDGARGAIVAGAESASGRRMGAGCRGGLGQLGGQGPRGVVVAWAIKRWDGSIWLVGLKQNKNFLPNFKLNFGI